MSAPAVPETFVGRLETDDRIDPIATKVRAVAKRFAREPQGPWLQGAWLGHVLHPLMTDLPIGFWTSAAVLDAIGGRAARPAAQRLIALGLLSVPPTVATGLADYAGIDDAPARRVGAVHAAGNAAVALCYLGSWNARRRGHQRRGVLWSLAGAGLATGTAYLGGHLAFS
jgi:uncharacterized membrane protein